MRVILRAMTPFALLVGLLGLNASPAGANTPAVTCGEQLTQSVVLRHDLMCSSTGLALTVVANNVTIDLNGHTVTGDIYVMPVTGFTVKHGTIKNGGLSGQYGAYTVSVLDVHFVTAFVQFGDPSGVFRIQNNRFDNTGVGFSFGVDLRVIMRWNTFVGPASGLGLTKIGSPGILIGGNRFDGGTGISLFETQNVAIDGNVIRHIRYAAIRFTSNEYDTTITNNLIEGSQVGISMPSTFWNTQGPPVNTLIARNVIRDNAVAGLYVFGNRGGSNNVVSHNLFSHNGFSPSPSLPGVNDGINVTVGQPWGPGGITLTANVANHNADYGIEAPGVTDGGRNMARANGNPAQCLGVAC